MIIKFFIFRREQVFSEQVEIGGRGDWYPVTLNRRQTSEKINKDHKILISDCFFEIFDHNLQIFEDPNRPGGLTNKKPSLSLMDTLLGWEGRRVTGPTDVMHNITNFSLKFTSFPPRDFPLSIFMSHPFLCLSSHDSV